MEKIVEFLKKNLLWVAVGIFVLVLFVLSQESRAEERKGSQQASVLCEQMGKMGRYATELIFVNTRVVTLQKMKQRFPEYAEYAEYILQITLEPPIMPGQTFEKELEKACLESRTTGV